MVSCVLELLPLLLVDQGITGLWQLLRLGETSTKNCYASDGYNYDLGWVGMQDVGANISGTEYDALVPTGVLHGVCPLSKN